MPSVILTCSNSTDTPDNGSPSSLTTFPSIEPSGSSFTWIASGLVDMVCIPKNLAMSPVDPGARYPRWETLKDQPAPRTVWKENVPPSSVCALNSSRLICLDKLICSTDVMEPGLTGTLGTMRP